MLKPLDTSDAVADGAALLSVENLGISFGSFAAVKNMSFSISRGECLTIIGESGSGKSVTASLIMNLIDMPPGRIDSGRVMFDGMDVLALPPRDRRALYGKRIAIVFQDPQAHLNPVYSVGWQISEVLRIHGVSRQAAREKTLQLLARVGIADPEQRYHAYPHQFSGGQRQRIMIAMAIAGDPDLLIADEPSTALDVTVQAQILELLLNIQRETGMAMLMITHDLDVAERVSDKIAVMQHGRIVEQGTLAQIFAAPEHAYTRQLIEARKHGEPVQRPAATEVLLQVENVQVQHRRHAGLFSRSPDLVRAVDGVSFDLHAGEILGIIGESGCGKSSLARTILRLDKPSAGHVLFKGADVQQLKGTALAEYRRSLQAVFQDPYSSLNTRMSVLSIISEPWELNPGVLPRQAWRGRAAELLEQVGLQASDLDKYPGEFSGGQRQRIAIARALALSPQVIVCDEAVSALDMLIQRQVMQLLAELRERLNLAYVFIAHDLHLVRDFADRVLVMRAGKVVEQGRTADVFSAPKSDYARLLLADFEQSRLPA